MRYLLVLTMIFLAGCVEEQQQEASILWLLECPKDVGFGILSSDLNNIQTKAIS